MMYDDSIAINISNSKLRSKCFNSETKKKRKKMEGKLSNLINERKTFQREGVRN